jgi:DNA-binding transcriptional regulator YbjK
MSAIDAAHALPHSGRMRKRTRLQPVDRKEAILQAAVLVYRRDGMAGLLRDRVAAEAGVSTGLVTTYYRPFMVLVEAVIKHDAMRNAVAEIMAKQAAR